MTKQDIDSDPYARDVGAKMIAVGREHGIQAIMAAQVAVICTMSKAVMNLAVLPPSQRTTRHAIDYTVRETRRLVADPASDASTVPGVREATAATLEALGVLWSYSEEEENSPSS